MPGAGGQAGRRRYVLVARDAPAGGERLSVETAVMMTRDVVNGPQGATKGPQAPRFGLRHLLLVLRRHQIPCSIDSFSDTRPRCRSIRFYPAAGRRDWAIRLTPHIRSRGTSAPRSGLRNGSLERP